MQTGVIVAVARSTGLVVTIGDEHGNTWLDQVAQRKIEEMIVDHPDYQFSFMPLATITEFERQA